MFGELPTTLTVSGVKYNIRSDFRSILRILAAYNDDDLSPSERVYVCLRQVYLDFEHLPEDVYAEAYKQALWFIACGDNDDSDSKNTKTVDWEHDEQYMFPAINKVAGKEIRLEQYVHWWTFIGYLHGISCDDTYGYVLMLRTKRAKGKKFEKHETEFWNQNRRICEINQKSAKTVNDQMAAIYEEILRGGE